MLSAYLSAIYLYPVKSLAGIKVKHWQVTDKGLQYDRKWMLIDSDQHFLSQRRQPRMALIKTAINDDKLVLTAPGLEPLILPLHPDGGEPLETIIWQDRCEARSVSKTADQWLSSFLQCSCRLVYQPDPTIRPVDQHYAQSGDRTAFSDGFPFLLTTESSLASLNRQMNLTLPMIRFRPNLVIAGCPDYAEDSWRTISIGAIDFRLPKPCSRCAITAIDPETAVSGKEPLLTLNRTRKWNQEVFFGQNALHDNMGQLQIGDGLHVHSTGPRQPPLL